MKAQKQIKNQIQSTVEQSCSLRQLPSFRPLALEFTLVRMIDACCTNEVAPNGMEDRTKPVKVR